MQRMIEIYSKIIELKKKRMEIIFAPINAREKNFVKHLRNIKKDIAKAETELHSIRTGGNK
jgi:hypothetical protein